MRVSACVSARVSACVSVRVSVCVSVCVSVAVRGHLVVAHLMGPIVGECGDSRPHLKEGQ